jgi:hypothetical protein
MSTGEVLSIGAGMSVGAAEEAPVEAAVEFAARPRNQAPYQGVLSLLLTSHHGTALSALAATKGGDRRPLIADS